MRPETNCNCRRDWEGLGLGQKAESSMREQLAGFTSEPRKWERCVSAHIYARTSRRMWKAAKYFASNAIRNQACMNHATPQPSPSPASPAPSPTAQPTACPTAPIPPHNPEAGMLRMPSWHDPEPTTTRPATGPDVRRFSTFQPMSCWTPSSRAAARMARQNSLVENFLGASISNSCRSCMNESSGTNSRPADVPSHAMCHA